MEAHRRLFTEAEDHPQLTPDSAVGKNLNRCILVRVHILYSCGKAELEGTMIRELPFRPPDWPRVEITDVSQLGSISELNKVDRPCHPSCPHAGAPEPH